jgi:hypothetical protein
VKREFSAAVELLGVCIVFRPGSSTTGTCDVAKGLGLKTHPKKVHLIVPGIFLEAIVKTPNLRHIHPIEIFPFGTARILGPP